MSRRQREHAENKRKKKAHRAARKAGASEGGTSGDAERRRELIRERAEHSNRCRENRGGEPLFETDANGDVFCRRDGRPVTDSRQTLAEEFYWMEVEWGSPGLVHDGQAEAFYARSGELALSRDFVDLRHLMGAERGEVRRSDGT